MSDKSKIEWTDATWNPIRGCTRVSEGCRNCYAERTAARFRGPGQPYEGLVTLAREPGEESKGDPRWTGAVQFVPQLVDQPLRWKRPRRIFVNSMSDLFHPFVNTAWINELFGAMMVCPQHTFQILTKRPERMKEYMCHVGARDIEPHMARLRPGIARIDWPWRNVWLGVSVEDQKTADERIPLLLQTPAAVRWVSYEPALGLVDFSSWLISPYGQQYGAMSLDWIVAGGESGPGARPAHPDWFRSVRDQCQAAGVPFFFKQWGEWLNTSQLRPAFSDAELDHKTFMAARRESDAGQPKADLSDLYLRVNKKRAGHLLDGREWREFPGVR